MTLQDSVRYFTEEACIMPCLSVACGTAGHDVSAMGGVIDREGTPLSEKTLFDLASVTKLFTGLLAMRLRDEGKLDLSRSVGDYAPRYAHLRELSVEDVPGFQVSLTTPERLETQKSPEAARKQLWAMKPGPVTGRAYSDMHAMVMKDVLEGAAGENYAELLRSRILDPLGMSDTFTVVPENRRADCVCYDGEHRIEQGRFILRGSERGIPHDPKAKILWPEPSGHAGLFSTRGDLIRFAQGVLREKIVPAATLREMARNRTGFRRADGTYQQYLGLMCYVKHPVQYNSEIPAYMSDEAIGLAGFTGNHLSIDIGTGVFSLFLGNRVLDRLTVVTPASEREKLGLAPDGTGVILWPDGTRIHSSVDYVHHKDLHFHQAVMDTLALPRWCSRGTAWS